MIRLMDAKNANMLNEIANTNINISTRQSSTNQEITVR